jgi:hypothetical protein
MTRIALLALALVLTACQADDTDDTDTDTQNDTDTDTDTAPTSADAQAVVDANCTPCHFDGNDAAGMSLEDITAIVGTASSAPELDLIEPSSAADSYLWHKVSGTHESVGGSGDRMPAGRGPLSSADIDTLAGWIDAGAQ